MSDDTHVSHQALKLASVGAAWLGSLTMGNIASLLAAIYTALLIVEWMWKRVFKPFAINRHWIKGRPRLYLDDTDHTPL